LGLSVSQINLLITQNLASGLAAGSISALRLAQRVMQLPIGIFGIPIAMALFPGMTAQVAKNEMSDFKRTFSLGLRGIFLITIPAGVGLIALREPLIQLLFQQGKFTSSDTAATCLVLISYCFGIFAYSGIQLLNRVFYSLQDTITPVVVGIVSIVINIVFSLVLIGPMQGRGLALAYTLAGIVNLLVLIGILKWRLISIDAFKIFTSFVIAGAASGVMYLAVTFLNNYLKTTLTLAPKLNELIILISGIGLGVLVYGFIILLFKQEEAQLILGLIKRRIPRLGR